ncbi:MAG: type II toxin-antitoxin system RelE/ParE family toxin [Gammaproteobacteria bacterium]|nr:type II toxin-antitoxin system RelE/ParE family toxin [Gammaproteobacteria bacterium]
MQADLSGMPDGVRAQFSRKLQYLRAGQTVSGIAQWKGIGNGGRELRSGGYRLVFTIEFDGAIYVLHAFKKDSGKGRRTRRRHDQLVRERYKVACADYAARTPKH